jgi:hydroxyacylglutathione hydrolase
MTKLISFESGPVQTMAYLLIDAETRKGILVDAPLDLYDTLLLACRKNEVALQFIILTHGHFDHVGDAKRISETFNAPVLVHPADGMLVREPMTGFAGLPFHVDGLDSFQPIEDGEIVETGSLSLRILHTPGHTPGHSCVYDEVSGLLFSGDALFHRSVGRTDLPGGNYDLLMHSILSQLFLLPDATRVYPGHGEATSIGEEKLANPYVQEYLDHFDEEAVEG